MGLPLLTIGQVVSQDPDGGGVVVILRTTGQAPGYPVRMLYSGPADSLRIEQPPLPGRGTWGVVLFPYNDARNGIWLGSYYPNQVDAIAGLVEGEGPTNALESNIKYTAHFSGLWNVIDPIGQSANVYPDGSYVVVGSGFAPPDIYRHTLVDRKRVRSLFTQEQRVPDPPSPYNWTINTSGLVTAIAGSGFSLQTVSGFSLQASGAVSVRASGAVSIGSSTTFAISGTSGVSVSSDSGNVVFSAHNTTVTLAHDGSVTIETSGQLKLGSAAAMKLALADAVESYFNAHHHIAPSGGGPTGGPLPSMGATGASDIRVTS